MTDKQSSIVNYFDSTCRIIIDEFNFIFRGMSKEEKELYANEKFCEADLAFRLGNPFRHMARYTLQGTKGKDIIVDYKDFEVEVKYWRNWAGGNKRNSRTKAKWSENFESALMWLCNEIDRGKKGKRAFIAGWCTVFGWNKLLQLGASAGQNPDINMERIHMLPFLTCRDSKLQSVKTLYSLKESTFRIVGRESNINWHLFGEEDDSFNIVVYW